MTVTRTPLDDIHVIFYSDAGSTVVGNANGYIPDKVIGEQYNSKDVYRINVPVNATHFKITNGVGKGTGTSKERYSEVKQISKNGLYNFIEPDKVTGSKTDLASYVEDSTFSSTLSANTYLLGLENPAEPIADDPKPDYVSGIKIATIVTDETAGATKGKQKYIKWLKQVHNPDYNPDDPEPYQ